MVLPHEAITGLVLSFKPLSQVQPGDCVATISPLTFDDSVFDTFTALLKGGRLLILERDAVLDCEGFYDIVKEHTIQVFNMTTAVFELIAEHKPEVVKDMKVVMFGGEPVNPVALEKVLKTKPHALILDGYGPTETGMIATAAIYEPDSVVIPWRVGKPVPNSKIVVVDKHFAEVPPGVTGQILIGGSRVGLCYIN